MVCFVIVTVLIAGLTARVGIAAVWVGGFHFLLVTCGEPNGSFSGGTGEDNLENKL